MSDTIPSLFNSYDIPVHSFPQTLTDSNISTIVSRDFLNDELESILINSDSSVVNENFSIFIKCIMDNVYDSEGTTPTYETLSLLGLKLLTSNMFLKNFRFCIGKILAFLNTFACLTETNEINTEGENLKEFLCIVLLLLLKIKNTPSSDFLNCPSEQLELLPADMLYSALSEFNFVVVASHFISAQIKAANGNLQSTDTSYVILKFSCDIFFEYLFHIELFNDGEFTCLTNTDLIPTVITYLLDNENFNNYDLDSDDFENEDKLIAYEEFKLLLLINEQYMMRSYTSNVSNRVFDGLMRGKSEQPNLTNITGFINLLIYHLNREESNIIKILILKFLYLVFTTSYVTKMVYLNDLKILIDIFIRELNNMDNSKENRSLTLVYLRVFYPLLVFSQLGEIKDGYRSREVLDVFRNIIMSTDSSSDEEITIGKLATKCINIKWLKQRPKPHEASVITHTNSSGSSIESVHDKPDRINDSKESLTFTRVASVRASTRSDYHKHTTSHNILERRTSSSMILENNNNVFLANSQSSTSRISMQRTDSNFLDLPNEYLTKPLPKLPQHIYIHRDNSNDSVGSQNSLKLKASKKKAPPPPPPKPRLRHMKDGDPCISPTPPPPPPRRRH